jgi:hypothetical protein
MYIEIVIRQAVGIKTPEKEEICWKVDNKGNCDCLI